MRRRDGILKITRGRYMAGRAEVVRPAELKLRWLRGRYMKRVKAQLLRCVHAENKE